MPSSHDKVALRLARKHRANYNRGQGPDVKATHRVIEVETANTVRDGLRQLQGYRKPVYIAGSSDKATRAALRVTRGTTIGVMDSDGKVLRRSTRKQTRRRPRYR